MYKFLTANKFSPTGTKIAHCNSDGLVGDSLFDGLLKFAVKISEGKFFVPVDFFEKALGKHTITYIVSEKQVLAYDELAADFVTRTHELSLIKDKYDATYYSMNDAQRNVLWMLISSQEEIDALLAALRDIVSSRAKKH